MQQTSLSKLFLNGKTPLILQFHYHNTTLIGQLTPSHKVKLHLSGLIFRLGAVGTVSNVDNLVRSRNEQTRLGLNNLQPFVAK